MRLIKMFGLAAIAALASMALLGASSASANQDTALCTTHTEPCSSLATSVHFEAGTTQLVTNLATVLCLSSLAQGTVEGDGLAEAPNPLGVQLTSLTWNNCGTNSGHNNCTVNNLTLPLVDVLKTALNLGTGTALNVDTLVNCDLIIHCRFGGGPVTGFTLEGALHNGGTGSGSLQANGVNVPRITGLLCPNTANWFATYQSLTHLYITS